MLYRKCECVSLESRYYSDGVKVSSVGGDGEGGE